MDAAPKTASVGRKRVSALREPKLWLWCLCVPLAADGVEALVRNFTPPMWVRVLLCLVPLAPGFMFMRLHKRVVARADELQSLIEREAFAFTFYGMVAVLICVHLLENAAVIPGFAWTAKTLLGALAGLHVLGHFWIGRRYR